MSGWASFAERRPIGVNWSRGTSEPNRVDVIHVMQGSLWGTDAWFRNPAAEASAHFGVGFDGTIFQWVSCDMMAWHNCSGCGYSIGVETEGYSGTPFTSRQITACARILRWAHHEYPAISMWLNTRPFTGSGLSYHGLGGDAWCGHPACPGGPRVRQLPLILEKAKQL